MIVGYNPKVYLKEFLEDLKVFSEENNIEIEIVCTNEESDFYDVVHKNITLFSVELWDITNYENSLYQEIKIKYTDSSPLLNLIMSNPKIKSMIMGKDYFTFIVIDDEIKEDE